MMWSSYFLTILELISKQWTTYARQHCTMSVLGRLSIRLFWGRWWPSLTMKNCDRDTPNLLLLQYGGKNQLKECLQAMLESKKVDLDVKDPIVGDSSEELRWGMMLWWVVPEMTKKSFVTRKVRSTAFQLLHFRQASFIFISVFVKVNQNNYKYLDGNAVYIRSFLDKGLFTSSPFKHFFKCLFSTRTGANSDAG